MAVWSKVVDGETYTNPDDIPDLGSWKCYGFDENNKRDYQGFSTDIAKLPTYDDLAEGSSALCLDTGAVLLYHVADKTWYQL